MMNYTKKVTRHFLNPKNAGKIKNPDAIGRLSNDGCGDVMEISLKIDKKTEKIKNIKFQTLGCPAAIATSDVLCEMAKGKTLKQAENISDKDIVKKLDGLPMIKLHCSVLGSRTLKDAIEKYKKKNNARGNKHAG